MSRLGPDAVRQLPGEICAMSMSVIPQALRGCHSYGSQQGVHEFVRLVGSHQTLTFDDTHCQFGYNSQVLVKCLRQRDQCLRDMSCEVWGGPQ